MNSRKLPRADALQPLFQKTQVIGAPTRRLKTSACKNGHLSLMITACAVALFATTANAQSSFSAAALFNHANAAQREERFGPAILGYERACLLWPNEPSIEQNLRLAREKAGVNAPAIPLWQRPAYWLSFDGWAVIGSSALFIACALFFGLQYLPRRAARSIAASCGTLVVFAVAAIVFRWNELDHAVIQKTHTTVHVAPAANAQGTFELKAGDLVTAKREYGNFVLVRTLDQRSGWVNKSDLGRVIPTTSLSPM